jgi:hypothetical protein
MQLPRIFNRFLKPKKTKKKYYLTLIFDSDNVAGSCWFVEKKIKADLSYAVLKKVRIDKWEERLLAADEVITSLENKLGTEEFHDVILGLPSDYLCPDGDIAPKIKVKLKEITKELDLSPIGFVSLNQAIIYKMKVDEGVPPSLILISVTMTGISIFLYKVGALIGYKTIPNDKNYLLNIETVLKELLGDEVLPSKMVLFGADGELLLSIKENLIGYPWTSKLNFLHFPKIIILPPDFPVTSVSMAGAGELAKSFTNIEVIEDNPEASEEENDKTIGEIHEEEINITGDKKEILDNDTVINNSEETQTILDNDSIETITDDNRLDLGEKEKDDQKVKTSSKSSLDNHGTIEEAIKQNENSEDEDKSDLTINKNEIINPEVSKSDEDTNVRVVNPEEFGFKPNIDILEKPISKKTTESNETEPLSPQLQLSNKNKPQVIAKSVNIIQKVTSVGSKIKLPKVSLAVFKNKLFIGRSPLMLLVLLLIVVLGVAWFVIAILPKATLSITVETKAISETVGISIDPTVETIVIDKMLVPGKKIEKTISGEKTISTTGKKKVGDPAKGTVTIYNKSLSSRTFKKGSILNTGGIKFTLDSDVQIASASESVGSITFGKETGNVTAMDIGAQGNVVSGSEFSFSDLGSGVASARNDQAFAGGTSKEITVVSRADYDTLVKTISADLLNQSKSELGSSSSGSFRLIDSTIKTSVSDKKFSQEVDEEAKQLHGTVSVLVSGIGYEISDVQKLLLEQMSSKIPTGYELMSDKTTVEVNKILVKKDGKITAEASINIVVVPKINEVEIKKVIAGKSINEVESKIKQIPGVSDVNIQFQSAIIKNRLPSLQNITVLIKILP